jgi:hypothetical protein
MVLPSIFQEAGRVLAEQWGRGQPAFLGTAAQQFVMAGQKREARLRADVPAIHALAMERKGVDARVKPG